MLNKFFLSLALLISVSPFLVAEEDQDVGYRRYRRSSHYRIDPYRGRLRRDLYRNNYFGGQFYNPYYSPYFTEPYYPFGLPGADPNRFEEIYEQNLYW